ncbi:MULTISPECIES: hypothetical protein [Agrobacterium tumefaciens complex]|jgi:hypothetical protein|uniref:hypothetical protein n=1 Tax=Agrobacterium tumefaciens complex TaxID=1183400 RepID=UPI000DD51554|nr:MULTISPECIES: hypothetical protein [Agrobacterium tumefaciens complex]MBB4406076.1 hypothetical protein [Agrobacterium radiobacter]MBB4450516.1 hypothetical protein [Agrobacterium radiobacter]MDR6588494.1 hypothetical protein [Agrobacterium tumefaciens]
MENEFSYRKELTFEQAEGAAPLPSQLALKEVSDALVAKMWQLFHDEIEKTSGNWLSPTWSIILKDHYVDRLQQPVDTFDTRAVYAKAHVKHVMFTTEYVKFFGFIQYVLRHPSCPSSLRHRVDLILAKNRAAYRVFDGDTIAPFATEEEGATAAKALDALKSAGMDGARSHLRKAMSELTAGSWAGSIRESIHAVESVARTIAPGANTLGPALTALEKNRVIHSALKSAFGSIYGFTSDAGGIRHALLEKNDAEVDEADAMFMLGACSAFVTYLIQKKRAAGI